MIDPCSTNIAISLACATAESTGKAVPTVVGALKTLINALVKRAEFMVEVPLYVVPAGYVG